MACIRTHATAVGVKSSPATRQQLRIKAQAANRKHVVVARFGGGGREGVAERPSDVSVVERAGWNTDKDSGGLATLPRPDEGDGAASGGSGSNGGNYRLLLVDSSSHTERRVVAGLCGVVQGVDEAHAKNCFQTSRQLGMAIVVSSLRERVEFYRQQLYLHGVKTAMEPDTMTT